MTALYTKTVTKQREFFQQGKTRSLTFRREQLLLLKQMIAANEARILNALKADLGKSDVEGYLTEIGFVLKELNYLKRNLKRFSRPQRVPTPLAYFAAKSRLVPEPYGVALIISPWNYPFQLALGPLVGAIAAGNCGIIKPSEHAPHAAALLAELIAATFAPEYITTVLGEIPETQALLKEKFDYIFFTGSSAVGKIIMEGAAKQLTPVTLELGGKSPCIIESDADLELAAKRIAWGKFLNAGQTCVAPDYVLIKREIKKQFISEIKTAIEDFYGNDIKGSEHFGRIINTAHFNRLTSLLAEGSIVCGGDSHKEELYIAPTILTNVARAGELMKEEIFGPLLPVLPYERIEEAVEYITKRPKPLALYLFTRDQTKINYVIANTSSGGVCGRGTPLIACLCRP